MIAVGRVYEHGCFFAGVLPSACTDFFGIHKQVLFLYSRFHSPHQQRIHRSARVAGVVGGGRNELNPITERLNGTPLSIGNPTTRMSSSISLSL